MSSILIAFIILSVLGALLGIGLAIADKKFSIEKDPKLEEIEASMPGANCGGCGFAGCSAYAQAVFEGTAKPGLCAPGGQTLADKMCSVMGLQAEKVERMVAHVYCSGNPKTTAKAFDYKGIKDCNAASLLFKGDNECKSGCLHMMSCASVCESNAIYMDNEGNVKVDRDLCIGCGKCTKICPNQVIRLVPYSEEFFVDCNNHQNGATVRKICETGCIGCKICEVKFPESGFKVDNFLSQKKNGINTEDTAKACEACPRKTIKKLS